MTESVNLMPALLNVEINDDAEEARYTSGEMWFTEEYREQLRELATLPKAIDSVKVMIHRRIYHFQGVYFNTSIEQVKQNETTYLKIKYGAEDLLSINEWTIPAKATRA